MAQLKLTLSDADVDAIRDQAQRASKAPSVYLRDLALGEAPEVLSADSVQRLDDFEERLEHFTRAANALRLRVETVEQALSSDPTEGLDRRLSRLEEMAGF